MPEFRTLTHSAADIDTARAEEIAARGNRRRLRAFLLVLVPALLAGLAYTFLRPPEYRAQARIAVKPAGVVTDLQTSAAEGATVSTAASAAGSLQAEAGVLSSRPVIEAALAALRGQGVALDEFGPDPVQGVQAALSAAPVADSNIIGVAATGGQPEHLAALVNALIDAYSRRLLDSYSSAAGGEIDALRQELQDLNRRLEEKRKALEDFRQAADIVSGERDENQVLARVKGLSLSLNQANEKVAKAEGRVRSLRESLAAGRPVVRARDNPTLAGLESRASQLRESLRDMERTHTPQFMDMDPEAHSLRSRLAELEAQIAETKSTAGQVSLAEAEEELATAREEQQTLQAQITRDRGAVHAFSRSFGTFKSMQEELAQLETSRSAVSERLLRTEASERSRMPSVQVIEAATAPVSAWRPDYARDAAISVAAALGLALLAMGVTELFNRPPRPPATPVIVPQPWIAVGQDLPPALAAGPAARPLRGPAAGANLLASPAESMRELSQEEVAALLRTLSAQDSVWAGLLLCGATPGEIRGLAPADVDAAAARVRLAGASARELPVPPGLCRRLAAAPGPDGGGAALAPGTDEELQRRLLCAAHDAGLDDPAGITPDTLRHTCIAHLVRQGLRFGDLDRIVGPLPADALARYAGLSPAGVRRSLAEVSAFMPGLHPFDGGQA
ncbi:GumC family protein [Thauera sinica]|uniref:GumC family protein n=1 Tax=Thauera sinica TaxID=2665146 RepID=A0ABW1ANF5_9RHOO|nr:Wzz/FepE/Etk N-terminal domain-containing protein [Thauera sp. K11]ATE61782.1 hypothetical protein CCZ27_19040 [Thauera sp. K11]